MSRTLLAVVVLVAAVASIAWAEETPPGGVSSVPSTPAVGGPAPVPPLSPAPVLWNPNDAFAVGDAFTDLGADRAREILDKTTDAKTQMSKLSGGGRAVRKAAAEAVVKNNRSRLAAISREVKGAERWGTLGPLFDVANLAMGAQKEGGVGAEKAVANKVLGDLSTWLGVEGGALVGSCLGPGGAAAGALVGGFAGSLCYAKGVQKGVEANIEADAARRQREAAAREREERLRKEIASDMDRWLAEREREDARRRHEEFKAWHKQRAEWEAFIAAQTAKERVDAAAGSGWAQPGVEVIERSPTPSEATDSGWAQPGVAVVDRPPMPSGPGDGREPQQPQPVIVMPLPQSVMPPPILFWPSPQPTDPRLAAPPAQRWPAGGRSTAAPPPPPTQPPTGRAPADASRVCDSYQRELQALVDEQRRLTSRVQAAQAGRREGEARNLACQMVTNSNKVLNLLQRMRSAGCPVGGDLDMVRSQMANWNRICAAR